MSYSSFTAKKLKEQFGITQVFERKIFANVKPIEASKWLKHSLDKNADFAVLQGSEKARSEFIIAPVLAELREIADGKISLFSGVRFDVDKSQNLEGVSDFLISRSPDQAVLDVPVVVAVEAKRQDFEKGIAQCVAEMYAARIFNERKNSDIKDIYGCVTIGNGWQFLILKENRAIIEPTIYDLNEDLERILGILYAMSLGLISQ
jgi:hypothetical protein